MITVSEARKIIEDSIKNNGSEVINIHNANARILAENVTAKRSQPPFDASAMDGYAVAFDHLNKYPKGLILAGESRAGQGYPDALAEGETVRIFTGAPLPRGADTVIIQENVEIKRNKIIWTDAPEKGKHVRPLGNDFHEGETLLSIGQKLEFQHIALLLAANITTLKVAKRPRIALIISGDEIKEVGSDIGPNDIINSNARMLSELFNENGADVVFEEVIGDDETQLKNTIAAQKDVEFIVTVGGASVGKYDLMRNVLTELGMHISVPKLLLRPGKPFFFGTLDEKYIFGLPGNPVSALTTALLFVVPSISRALGKDALSLHLPARLEGELAPNGSREIYMRGFAFLNSQGQLTVRPSDSRDSASLKPLIAANCLINRACNAPKSNGGESVQIIQFGPIHADPQ